MTAANAVVTNTGLPNATDFDFAVDAGLGADSICEKYDEARTVSPSLQVMSLHGTGKPGCTSMPTPGCHLETVMKLVSATIRWKSAKSAPASASRSLASKSVTAIHSASSSVSKRSTRPSLEQAAKMATTIASTTGRFMFVPFISSHLSIGLHHDQGDSPPLLAADRLPDNLLRVRHRYPGELRGMRPKE